MPAAKSMLPSISDENGCFQYVFGKNVLKNVIKMSKPAKKISTMKVLVLVVVVVVVVKCPFYVLLIWKVDVDLLQEMVDVDLLRPKVAVLERKLI